MRQIQLLYGCASKIALNQLYMYETSQEAPQLIVFFIKNQGALEEEGG